MKAKLISSAVLLILPLMFIGLVACGTDSGVASNQAGDVIGDAGSVAVTDETHDDEDDHAVVVADEHDDGDGHAVVVADGHHDEATESHAHMVMDGPVDPDAPVMQVVAFEFAYDTAMSEVKAGQPFSIQIQNDGLLEHDITFVGLESEFGLHVQPGEEDIATFSIHEAGEYTYYCTVLGHREAGMTGTLVVSAELVGDHDDADGHDDEAEATHEDDHDNEAVHEGEIHDDDAPGA